MSSMYVFTPKREVQIVMFYWLYKTRIGWRSCSSTTDNSLDFYTNKTKQQLRWDLNLLSLIGPWRNVKRCLLFRRNSNLFLFLTFRSRTLPKSSQACGKKRKTLKFWNAAISKYIQLAFSCVMEKLLIFYIYEIKSGVMWSSSINVLSCGPKA